MSPPNSAAPPPEADGPPPPPGAGPPPWINPFMQSEFDFQDNDVVVSVPFKSGTTWCMNIVHQLRTGGDADFEDIYKEVPWIEFMERPGQTKEELLERWKALTPPPRRCFKTHGYPPILAFNPNVKYLIVLRNPEEACVAARFFFEKHTDEFFDLWKAPKAALCRDSFEQFFHDVFFKNGFVEMMLFGFVKAWWPYRNEPNVCMLHFSDMKKDHEGSMRYIAEKLGFFPTQDQWLEILTNTSFSWMKENQQKFEGQTLAAGKPVLMSGGMMRKGQAGHAADDGMTPEIANIIRQEGERILNDSDDALDYYYNGGNLPPNSSDASSAGAPPPPQAGDKQQQGDRLLTVHC